MTATAEKPTCQYSTRGLYTYTRCGQMEWTDETRKANYCKHCGGEIEREEECLNN